MGGAAFMKRKHSRHNMPCRSSKPREGSGGSAYNAYSTPHKCVKMYLCIMRKQWPHQLPPQSTPATQKQHPCHTRRDASSSTQWTCLCPCLQVWMSVAVPIAVADNAALYAHPLPFPVHIRVGRDCPQHSPGPCYCPPTLAVHICPFHSPSPRACPPHHCKRPQCFVWFPRESRLHQYCRMLVHRPPLAAAAAAVVEGHHHPSRQQQVLQSRHHLEASPCPATHQQHHQQHHQLISQQHQLLSFTADTIG